MALEVVQRQQGTALTRITEHAPVNSLPVHCPPVRTERSSDARFDFSTRLYYSDTSTEPHTEVDSCGGPYPLQRALTLTDCLLDECTLNALESCVLNFITSAITFYSRVENEHCLMHIFSFCRC